MLSDIDRNKSDHPLGANKPDFLCIGAQKAATSWLNKVLLESPHVFMPPVNELHFFDRMDQNLPLKTRHLSLAKRAIKKEKGREGGPNQAYLDYLNHIISFPTADLEWYRAAYSWPVSDGVKKGDITPAYMELPENVVAYARRLLGETKLIAIVRRPADRLLSQMRMWAGRDKTDEAPSEEKWFALLRRIERKAPRGAYSQGIPIWRSYFGSENLLILPFSDIRTDPRATIARVEDHIGVPRFQDYALLTETIHPTKKYEIPDVVKQAVAKATAAEDDYLRSEFGEEFFEKTR